MTMFQYRALNGDGKLLEGTIEATTQADVLSQLDNIGLTPLSMRQANASGGRPWREWLTPEPGAEQITGFTVDLAMLLKGGVTLNEALVILTQMEKRRWLVALIRELHSGLAGGNSLSKVLMKHPKLFPPLYVKMVEVAEMSGRLEPALASIAQERQRTEGLRKRLISAMAYPGFLALAAIGVLIFVLLYIIPQFEGAIAGFRDKISPSALFVFRLSEALRTHIDEVVGTVLVFLVAVLLIKQIGKRSALWLDVLSRIPFTRQAVTYHMTLTFCRTLEILLKNGVDISTSLRLIRGISPLPATVRKIDTVIAEVRGGKRLSQALARETLLPAHVVQMLRVGEEAGDVGASAGRIAIFYETKLDNQLKRLTAVLGPVLMMGVSMLIGWLILSIMSALMSINDLLV